MRGGHATLEDEVVCINVGRHAEFWDRALGSPSTLEITDRTAGRNHSVQRCDIHRLAGFVHILQSIVRLVNDLCGFQRVHDRLDGGQGRGEAGGADGADDVESVGHLAGVAECFEERGEVMFLGRTGEEFKDGG